MNGTRVPRTRPPTHPGGILLREFIHPLGLKQTQVAAGLGISYPRLNEIVHGKRGITPDTALRLERMFGLDADVWLDLQRDHDLWRARNSPAAADLDRIPRLNAA
jgi:addiction module HigA family antidote